jgi:hypothetical protein
MDRIRTVHTPKFTDRNTVSSSDPLRKNKSTFLLSTLNNTPHNQRIVSLRKNNFPLKK